MKKTILYTSKYGTSQAYAEKLGEKWQLTALTVETTPELHTEQVFYIAPIYIGQVKALKNLLALSSP